MKRIFFAGFILALFAIPASAQVKAVQTVVIKTPNALCEACKTRIETYLKRYDGVLEINVNYRKAETKVKFVTDRINIEEIKTAICNVGYDADDVPANEDSYNRLPKTCKKFSDGGGHPKPKVVPVPNQ
ncbi:MAG TPA: cation transporter [Chitinophagaceae bacterium]|nr:cation transporter [Chitinophagaceae bacterium]